MEAVLPRIAPIGSAKRYRRENSSLKKLEESCAELHKILNFDDDIVKKALKEAREKCWQR